MLRAALVVLVAANLLFFAFTRGWFDGVMGLRSLGDREPERLGHQVRPESITLWPAAPASSAVGPVSCYEAGPFVTADALHVETMLRGNLPAGSWASTRSDAQVGSATVTTHTYRVAAADAALAARLGALRLDATGRSFTPCPDPARPR